jgi:hypothetical protein
LEHTMCRQYTFSSNCVHTHAKVAAPP